MREMKDAFGAARFSVMHAEFPWYWNRFPRTGIIFQIKGIFMNGLFTLVPAFRDAMLFVVRKFPNDSQK